MTHNGQQLVADEERGIQLIENLLSMKGYLASPLPNERDTYIDRIVYLFHESSSHEREVLRSAIDIRKAQALLTYSERMAIRTVREHRVTHVCNGLLAIALVDSQWDLRESILEMAVCYDAIIRIHADPMQIFADAAQYATEVLQTNFVHSQFVLQRIAVSLRWV